jgi:hypothetical protein
MYWSKNFIPPSKIYFFLFHNMPNLLLMDPFLALFLPLFHLFFLLTSISSLTFIFSFFLHILLFFSSRFHIPPGRVHFPCLKTLRTLERNFSWHLNNKFNALKVWLWTWTLGWADIRLGQKSGRKTVLYKQKYLTFVANFFLLISRAFCFFKNESHPCC